MFVSFKCVWALYTVLYGKVPLIIISKSMKSDTVGVFWFHPMETFVDIQ
jgi:hypothetical protein